MQSLVKRIGYFLKDDSVNNPGSRSASSKYYKRYFLMDNANNFYCTSSYARLEFLIQSSDTLADLFRNAKNNLKCEKQYDYKITDIKSYPQPEVIPFLNQKYFEMHITQPTPDTNNSDVQSTHTQNSSKKSTKSSNTTKVDKLVLYIFTFKDDHLQHMHNFFKNYAAEAKNVEELNANINCSPLYTELAQAKTPKTFNKKFFSEKADSDGSLNELSKTQDGLLKKLKTVEDQKGQNINENKYDIDPNQIDMLLNNTNISDQSNKDETLQDEESSKNVKKEEQKIEEFNGKEKDSTKENICENTITSTAQFDDTIQTYPDDLNETDIDGEIDVLASYKYDHFVKVALYENKIQNMDKNNSNIDPDKNVTEVISEDINGAISENKIDSKIQKQKDSIIKQKPDKKSEPLYMDHEELKLDNNVTYSGPTRNGVPDGKGKEFMPDGISYVGEFRNGKKHGTGYIVDTDMMCYVEYINGKQSGI